MKPALTIVWLLLLAFVSGCYPFNPNGRNWIEQGKVDSGWSNPAYVDTSEFTNDVNESVATIERLREQRSEQ